MRAESVILKIRAMRESGDLGFEEGQRLLMAWNAIQNLAFMQEMFERRVKEQAREALAAVNRDVNTTSLDMLEIEILDYLELI